MRLRFKFSKTGNLKYIGHLDVMRYFQKALRRCNVDAAFSEGYSPHMLMSIALPLSVGTTSEGEYFDLEVNSSGPLDELKQVLNSQMADGIKVISVSRISEEKSYKCMTLVDAADYMLIPQDSYDRVTLENAAEALLAAESIIVIKKTKKSEKEVDIRPMIYDAKAEDEGLFVRIAAGSAAHLRPDLVSGALLEKFGLPFGSCRIHRLDLLANEEGTFIPLSEAGAQ